MQRSLCTIPVDISKASTEIITTGPIYDMFFKFKSQEEQVFVTFVDDDTMPTKKFTFFFINHDERERIDITDSLEINFKFFKTIDLQDSNSILYVFVKEELVDL